MKVIIEIPDDTEFINMICHKIIHKEKANVINVSLKNSYKNLEVKDLKIIATSCKGCRFEFIYDTSTSCAMCRSFSDWEAKDETNIN